MIIFINIFVLLRLRGCFSVKHCIMGFHNGFHKEVIVHIFEFKPRRKKTRQTAKTKKQTKKTASTLLIRKPWEKEWGMHLHFKASLKEMRCKFQINTCCLSCSYLFKKLIPPYIKIERQILPLCFTLNFFVHYRSPGPLGMDNMLSYASVFFLDSP